MCFLQAIMKSLNLNHIFEWNFSKSIYELKINYFT
jgi:hypothetical protein